MSGSHFWSLPSDLRCSVSNSPVSFSRLPACKLSPWATAVCLSREACGQQRSPNFSGHLPCNISLMYLLNIIELKFLKGQCGYQGVCEELPLPLLATNMFSVWSYGRVVLILDGRSFLLEIWYWLPTNKTEFPDCSYHITNLASSAIFLAFFLTLKSVWTSCHTH